MIYVIYIAVAALVVVCSDRISKYVDLLDKKTKLSGAFIGGVMLSAVTSLPELFTSVSSTLFLDKPGLCMGNVLGSNLFNAVVISALIIIFFRQFKKAAPAVSHVYTAVFVFLIYAVLCLNYVGVLRVDIITVNITSIVIAILYVLGVKSMSSSTENGNDVKDTSELTVRQITVRFVLMSIAIVALSIIITFVTDKISEKLNLGAGLAGALFLGIATSLPELSSTFTLFKIKNYNIAIGNIVGSNLFNFIILAITDIIYIRGGVYDFGDAKTVNLLITGTLAALAMIILLRMKNKLTQLLCPITVIICYVAFLLY